MGVASWDFMKLMYGGDMLLHWAQLISAPCFRLWCLMRAEVSTTEEGTRLPQVLLPGSLCVAPPPFSYLLSGSHHT